MIGFLLDLAFGGSALRILDGLIARQKLRALRRGRSVKIYGSARFPDGEGLEEEALAEVSPGLIVLEARMGRPRRFSLPLQTSDLSNVTAAEGWARYAIGQPAGGRAVVFACKVEYSQLLARAAEARMSG